MITLALLWALAWAILAARKGYDPQKAVRQHFTDCTVRDLLP
jgi:hypothetical protein